MSCTYIIGLEICEKFIPVVGSLLLGGSFVGRVKLYFQMAQIITAEAEKFLSYGFLLLLKYMDM